MTAYAATASNSLKFIDGPEAAFRFADALARPKLATDKNTAIYLRLSLVAERIRRAYHSDMAKYLLATFDDDLSGEVFQFENSDIVMLYPDADPDVADRVTRDLRGLFKGMGGVQAEDGTAAICNWFDLTAQAEQFEEISRHLAKTSADPNATIASAADARDKIAPINTEMLTKLERGVRTIDVSSFLRRQPICKILPGLHTNPKHVANEVYVHVADLRSAILPGVDLTANRWLFRHLTSQLDRRVLSAIQKDIQSFLREPISLNMNIKNIMSEDFTQLVRLLSPSQREKIIIEIHCVDLLADTGAFMFVKSYLNHTGFKMALDGTDMFSFPELARHDIGFDFIKLQWSDMLENGLSKRDFTKLQETVAKIGSEKVILCHCGSPSAKDVGHKLGIHNFQGRFIDEFFNPSGRRRN
jgi:EAL domain-containing protein (putative c-di-GMP-specific phosphodiesterase class I)